MYFVARATDYDGTSTGDGLVAEETIAALGSFRQSGRKLILVSGPELPDLRRWSRTGRARESKKPPNTAIPSPHNERARHRYY